MTMKTEPIPDKSAASGAEKAGFFQRLFGKLDAKMKAKAEANAAEGCCCNSGKKDDKGDQCC